MDGTRTYICIYQESQDWLDHVYIGCHWSFLEMYSYCQNLPNHGFRYIGSAGFDSCKQQPNSIYRCITLLYIFWYIYIPIKMMYSNRFHIIHPLPVERSLDFFFVTRLFWARLIIEKMTGHFGMNLNIFGSFWFLGMPKGLAQGRCMK